MQTHNVGNPRNKRRLFAGLGVLVLGALLCWSIPGGAGAQVAGENDVILEGARSQVAGGWVVTWARVRARDGRVKQVGATIPMEMADNQAAIPLPGPGPAGAVAVLPYPPVVQETTYFNHLEVHSNPNGHASSADHADPNRYRVPHFDFHFYGIPEAMVWSIPRVVDPALLPHIHEELLPEGWAQPHNSVAQMGRHSYPFSEFPFVGPFDAVNIAGFVPDGSYLHFIEPMVTAAFMQRREGFTLPVPVPQMLGRETRFPTEFEARYNRDLDAYHFVFGGFEDIE